MTLQRTPKPNDSQLAEIRLHLKREPGNGRLWLVLAQMLSHFPPGQELRHAADEAIRLLPDNYQAWLLSGSLLQHKRGAAALDWLESVARQNPHLAAIRLARASMSARRDPAGAIGQFRDIAQAFPSDTRAHLLLAELYKGRGSLGEAAECMEQVLRMQPERAQYWGMLAEIRLVEGQWDKAISAATAAINLDRNVWTAREVRADAHQKVCSWDEALADYRAIAGQHANNPRILNKVGVCLVRQERLEEAREHFDRALKSDPEFAEAKVNVGFLQAMSGQQESAAALITEAVASGKLDARSRHAAVTALSLLNEQQRLAPLLQEARETGSVSGLHKALAGAPAELSRPDPASVAKLMELADMCRGHGLISLEAGTAPVDTGWLAFCEACAHGKLDRETIVTLARGMDIAAGPAGNDRGDEHRGIINVWQTVLDRKDADPGILSTAEGEAWLKYWHARLLEGATEKQPGQYKAIQNTIGRETPTPPANVSGTYRTMLADMRAAVPAGVPRGVFMLLALNLVHGFCDGNGRLSRFTMAWELEAAGLPAISIPLELRDDYTKALVSALWRLNPEPLLGVFARAVDYRESLLKTLLR